jgi:hypothetical protein
MLTLIARDSTTARACRTLRLEAFDGTIDLAAATSGGVSIRVR